jgi:hypothetical protein
MSSLTELLERQSVHVLEATIPADMTITEWRRRRAALPVERTARSRRLGWPPRLLQGGTP